MQYSVNSLNLHVSFFCYHLFSSYILVYLVLRIHGQSFQVPITLFKLEIKNTHNENYKQTP
jgi:hypothetical protein